MQPAEVKCRMEGPKAQVIDLRVWSREVCTKEDGSLAAVLCPCTHNKLSQCGQEERETQDKETTWVFLFLTALS